MTWFEDLSAYEYGGRFEPDTRTVGWLDHRYAFSRGEASPDFILALQVLARTPTRLMRGRHVCDLCLGNPSGGSPMGGRRPRPRGRPSGNGEIRVTGADGTTYAAPILVVHYVTEHGYLPPQGFMDAVLYTGSHRGDTESS